MNSSTSCGSPADVEILQAAVDAAVIRCAVRWFVKSPVGVCADIAVASGRTFARSGHFLLWNMHSVHRNLTTPRSRAGPRRPRAQQVEDAVGDDGRCCCTCLKSASGVMYPCARVICSKIVRNFLSFSLRARKSNVYLKGLSAFLRLSSSSFSAFSVEL